MIQIKGKDGNDRLSGGGGADQIWSGKGSDMISGGGGKEQVALEKGLGVDRIEDFKNGQDNLGLTGGLRFGQLDIDKQGSNTLIRINKDPLAVLIGVKPNQITAADFIKMSVS
jgi:Ca2+-binding RTX toxin-like protein